MERSPAILISRVQRHRGYYAVGLLLILLVGLSTRKFPALWPAFVAAYGGDTLWALLVFVGLGFLFLKASTLQNGGVALGFSYLIELSQLFQAPWINAVRHTTLGGLILGFSFLWTDFACYTVGVLLGVAAEWLIIANASKGNKYWAINSTLSD